MREREIGRESEIKNERKRGREREREGKIMRLKRKRVRKGDCVNTLRGWKSGPMRVSKRGKSWLRECLRKRERV